MTTEKDIQDAVNENQGLVKKAKKAVKKMIILYIVLAITCMFLFQFKMVAIIISLLQTGFALYFYNKSKGIVTLDYNTKSVQPSLFFLILIPIITLFAVGIMDITILDYSNYWAPFFVFLLIFILVVTYLIKKNEGKKSYQSIIISVIFGVAFSFGFTINTNEVFSINADERYEAQITDKWIVEGKSTIYHFMLLPWGPMKDTNIIKVQQDEYEKYKPGDTVTLTYNLGLYKMPYVKLAEK